MPDEIQIVIKNEKAGSTLVNPAVDLHV